MTMFPGGYHSRPLGLYGIPSGNFIFKEYLA